MSGAPPSRSASLWQRGFTLQMIVTLLASTAVQATRPTVTYRALALGASPLEIGLIQSAFSIVPALTAIAIGRSIDRIGESRYLMFSLGALTVGSVVALVSPGLFVLGVAQILMGLGQIVYLVASQSLVANHGPRQGRDVRYGHYATFTSLGQLAGPAIAAAIVGSSIGLVAMGANAILASAGSAASPVVIDAVGVAPDNPEAGVFLFAAIITVIGFGLAFFIPGSPRRKASEGTVAGQPGILVMTRQVLRRPGMLSAMFVSITVISSVDVLAAYLPAYGDDVGLSVALVGTLLSVRAGASLVSRFFMAQLIAVLGRSRLLAVSMIMAGGGLLLMPLVTSPPVLIAIMVVVGLGLGLGQPMTIAWIANRSQRSERATALGVRLAGNRAALLFVPTAMGAIAGTAGISAIFVVVAISLGIGAAVALATTFDQPAGAAAAGATDLPA
jgi:MFS family permease